MSQMVQIWRPLVCDCVIHQVVDDGVAGGAVSYATHAEAMAVVRVRFRERPSTTKNPDREPQPPAKQCPAHAALGFTPAMYAAARADNNALDAALEIVRRDFQADVGADPRVLWTLKVDRTIELEFPERALSPIQKRAIELAMNTAALSDTRLKVGKVKVR